MSEDLQTKTQAKVRFTVAQLATAFATTAPTIRKMIGQTLPIAVSGRTRFWHIGDVAEMKDTREPYIPQEPDEEVIETNPDKMTPKMRLTHYQAEDAKQASEAKERKNRIENRELIPAREVEQALAQAFKEIALMLDTFPDVLERDGYIGSQDVEAIIKIFDSGRNQLANNLTALAPQVEDMNDEEDW